MAKIFKGNVLSDVGTVKSGDYFAEIGREELLSKEQELELMKKIKTGDKAAYKEMIRKNLRLVVQIAVKNTSKDFGLMDRISEGNLGLIHAIEKFDVTKGFRFSTYAHWWIKQSIERGIMNQGRSLRLPAHVVNLLSKYNKASCRITNANSVTMDDIAKEIDCSTDHLHQILANCENVLHLNQKEPDSDLELTDIIADEDAEDGMEDMLSLDLQKNILNVLKRMPPYEHFVVVRHMGLIGNERNTLDEMAKLTGFTREQIRTREKNAIKKFKEDLI